MRGPPTLIYRPTNTTLAPHYSAGNLRARTTQELRVSLSGIHRGSTVTLGGGAEGDDEGPEEVSSRCGAPLMLLPEMLLRCLGTRTPSSCPLSPPAAECSPRNVSIVPACCTLSTVRVPVESALETQHPSRREQRHHRDTPTKPSFPSNARATQCIRRF